MIPGARSLGLRLAVFVPEMRVMGRPCLWALPTSTLFEVWLSLGSRARCLLPVFHGGEGSSQEAGC